MTSSAESTRQGVSHASEHSGEIARPGQRRALSPVQAGGVGCPVGEPSPDTSRSVLSQTVTWPDVVSSALYGDLFTRRGLSGRSQV